MAPSPRLPRSASLALALAVAGLLATACGGAATSSPSPSGVGPSSAASASTASAGPAGETSAVPAESAPPGDIPDNLAFVRYSSQAGGYSFTHPEGWAETGSGTRVSFTDKLNGVTTDVAAAVRAPTVDEAKTTEVARLQSSVLAFELRDVATAKLPGGTAVRIVFRRNADPDPVTGNVYRDEVEEYLVFRAGRLVRMDLFGPVGADNVDAYRTMSQSLTIR